MIVAIPYVPSRADFSALEGAIKAAGPCQYHTLLVLSAARDSEAAAVFRDNLKHLFQRSEIKLVADATSANGYGELNALFATAAQWAVHYKEEPGEVSNPPLLYFDPSQIPTTSGWADAIQAEYYKKAGRVLGVKAEVEDRQLSNGAKVEGGHLFTGSVVVDKGFASRSTLLNFLTPAESWRASLRWEMLASHAESALIGQGEGCLLSRRETPVAEVVVPVPTTEPAPAKPAVPSKPAPRSVPSPATA